MLSDLHIGCAGWGIPLLFRVEEKIHNLKLYSRYFSCVEINSTFYRNHKMSTFENWASLVPANFRFALKVPRSVSHANKLETPKLIDPLIEGARVLGLKCGPILLQTAPSFEFEGPRLSKFIDYIRRSFDGSIVIEPRHVSWFSKSALSLARRLDISLVAADPGPKKVFEAQAVLRGNSVNYVRLHGQPKIYVSSYSEDFLRRLVRYWNLSKLSKPTWVIFDNTAIGYSFANAIKLTQMSRTIKKQSSDNNAYA